MPATPGVNGYQRLQLPVTEWDVGTALGAAAVLAWRERRWAALSMA